jgi:hypothetical protein
VSDRAKQLINLAKEKLGVISVADLFHLKFCINKLLTLALASKLESANIEWQKSLQEDDKIVEIREQEYGKVQFYTDLYVESVQNISHCVHPFYQGNQVNTSIQAGDRIEKELENIRQVVNDCEIADKYKLIEKAENQVSDAVSVIDLWWNIVKKDILQMNLELSTLEWFKNCLLPVTYWKTTLQKTKHKPTQEKIKLELLKCQQAAYKIVIDTNKTNEDMELLKEKAKELCKMFQRSSSQVEGRNGYLSMINHTQRGFDTQRLQVLTVVHNYDIRGIDGKTPAERLFKNAIDNQTIFEYLITHIGEMALARKRKPKTIDNQFCPILCG